MNVVLNLVPPPQAQAGRIELGGVRSKVKRVKGKDKVKVKKEVEVEVELGQDLNGLRNRKGDTGACSSLEFELLSQESDPYTIMS